MNVVKVWITPKYVKALVETDRGTQLQVEFPKEMEYPQLDQVVAILEQRIIEEAKRSL